MRVRIGLKDASLEGKSGVEPVLVRTTNALLRVRGADLEFAYVE